MFRGVLWRHLVAPVTTPAGIYQLSLASHPAVQQRVTLELTDGG